MKGIIPDGKLYMDGQLGAGTVATLEDSSVNTLTAGGPIGFGTAVTIKDGKAVQAAGAPIYGVALKRTYMNADHFYQEDIDNDKWGEGEVLGVLRDGTIAVPVSADVDAQENATVDANGQFKPAGASDTVVGVFLSSANAGETAQLQTRVQLAQPTSSVASPAASPAASPVASQSTGSTTGSSNSTSKQEELNG